MSTDDMVFLNALRSGPLSTADFLATVKGLCSEKAAYCRLKRLEVKGFLLRIAVNLPSFPFLKTTYELTSEGRRAVGKP